MGTVSAVRDLPETGDVDAFTVLPEPRVHGVRDGEDMPQAQEPERVHADPAACGGA